MQNYQYEINDSQAETFEIRCTQIVSTTSPSLSVHCNLNVTTEGCGKTVLFTLSNLSVGVVL